MEGLGPVLLILIIAVLGFLVLWFIKKISSLLLTIISGILVVFIVIVLFMIVSDIANKPVPFSIVNQSYAENLTTGVKVFSKNPLILEIAQDGATNLSIDKITETTGNKVLIVINYQHCNHSPKFNRILVELPESYENHTFLLRSTQLPCQ
ncbi:MAG: hypothetical protein GXN92_01925 [Candidatus Micrarchaeota archaeon]|nr:hypothetical protein [Candidatus Micrarchaeota archaeon]